MPNNITLAEEIVEKSLSVRQTEKLVRAWRKPSAYMLRKQQEKEAVQRLAELSPIPAVPVVPGTCSAGSTA